MTTNKYPAWMVVMSDSPVRDKVQPMLIAEERRLQLYQRRSVPLVNNALALALANVKGVQSKRPAVGKTQRFDVSSGSWVRL